MITYKEAGVNIEEGYRSVKLICVKWSWKFCWNGGITRRI